MTVKIAAILAAAAVLASAGVASAQGRHSRGAQAPYATPYFNGDYAQGGWRSIGNRTEQRDPLAGTVFDGVAPY